VSACGWDSGVSYGKAVVDFWYLEMRQWGLFVELCRFSVGRRRPILLAEREMIVSLELLQ
jgi:hypothetical protein